MAKVFKNPMDQVESMIPQDNNSVYFGDSPLWSAAANGNKKYLDDYYKKGGKPNQKFNGFGKEHSLIMAAARNNRPEIVKMLEDYGEKPLSQDEIDELTEYKNNWSKDSDDEEEYSGIDADYERSWGPVDTPSKYAQYQKWLKGKK